MSAALEELKHVASSSRDARLFSCVSHAQTALSYAQRGVLSQTIFSLAQAQLMAERHSGACDDRRALYLMSFVKRECKVALCAKLT